MAEYHGPHAARPLDEWHEEIGPVLWWKFPVDEAPFSGDPRGDDWPGYHTHWTPIPLPALPWPEPPPTLDDALTALRVAQDAFKGWRNHPFGTDEAKAIACIDALLLRAETKS